MTSKLSGHTLHPLVGHAYLRLVSGKGVFVTDDAGKTYLDAVAGVGVVSLGYGREDLVTAAAEQARRIPYTHSMRFENEAQDRLANQLAAFCPPGLNWSFFCSGGSEALESAVKLVRQYWLDRGKPGKATLPGAMILLHVGSSRGSRSG